MPTKIGLFFGTTTGKTEYVAEMIQKEFNGTQIDLNDVSKVSASDLTAYDCLIIGCPTWNIGELQSDWEGLYDELDSVDLNGKKVAYFGTGDQVGYSDNFMDAIGIIAEKVEERGGITVGYWPTDGYDFNESRAVRDGKFVGLAVDEDNQPELTAARVKTWVAQVKSAFGV
ncbi:flavodoxin FldA [Pseudanabaena sp. PCC 6802]|uniref:flavodoxin FldA n=1 Tax=Pseudanabaena sp. PCC 6802 TaxID=118173 RepID=UPI000344A729|nr:flavodoxin FldA [Pseudanabaena sp. PCC 6802]